MRTVPTVGTLSYCDILETTGADGCILRTPYTRHRAYAQTSRWELSEWKERLARLGSDMPLVVGIEAGFSGERYMRYRLRQDLPTLHVHSTFEATMEAATQYLKRRWPDPVPRIHNDQ